MNYNDSPNQLHPMSQVPKRSDASPVPDEQSRTTSSSGDASSCQPDLDVQPLTTSPSVTSLASVAGILPSDFVNHHPQPSTGFGGPMTRSASTQQSHHHHHYHPYNFYAEAQAHAAYETEQSQQHDRYQDTTAHQQGPPSLAHLFGNYASTSAGTSASGLYHDRMHGYQPATYAPVLTSAAYMHIGQY